MLDYYSKRGTNELVVRGEKLTCERVPTHPGHLFLEPWMQFKARVIV